MCTYNKLKLKLKCVTKDSIIMKNWSAAEMLWPTSVVFLVVSKGPQQISHRVESQKF